MENDRAKAEIAAQQEIGSMFYKVVLQPSEEGYSVSCPALPGCWSQGETEFEALTNIKDAIEEYLDVLNDQIEGGIIREVEVAA